MRKIWMLSLANIRKSKGQTTGMLILMLMAVMLLNIGLVMYSDVGSFFDERATLLNAPHFIAFQSIDAPSNAPFYFMEGFPGVTEVEIQYVLRGAGATFIDNRSTFIFLTISYVSPNQQMNPLSLIGDFLPLSDDAIYIPHAMFLDGGFEIGDRFRLEFMTEELTFTLAGSTEEIMLGCIQAIQYRVYVPKERFLEISQQFPENRVHMLSARMEEEAQSALFVTSYIREFLGTEYEPWGVFTYDVARRTRIEIPMIVAQLVTVFSFILLVVGVIVIRFRTNNGIEENMENIGILKASGYRNYQIISSIIMQFGLIAFVGGLLGAAAAQIALPIMIGIVEPIIALPWDVGIDMLAMAFAILSVLVVVLLFTFLSSLRVIKLYPLTALRAGSSTHSFAKNTVPLDKYCAPLTVLLAAKQLLQNKKQAVMTGIIISGITFASVVGVSMYYNMNINVDAFVRMVTGEISDIVVTLNDSDDGADFMERMSSHPEVDNIIKQEGVTLLVNDIMTHTIVMEDLSLITGALLVDGRLPFHDNEIALGAPVLMALDKQPGDWVTIKRGDAEYPFLVTGIAQATIYNGIVGFINIYGLSQIDPDFAFHGFTIHLTDSADIDDFMYALSTTDGDMLANMYSMPEQVDVFMDMIYDVFSLIAALTLGGVAAVILLVLYLVIKTIILYRRRELGIQKALGFTTLQLMNQIALSLTPTVLMGTIIGSVSGGFGFNPLMVIVTRGVGIARADLPIPVALVVAVCATLVLLSYAVSILIAGRIRKISAYALVTER